MAKILLKHWTIISCILKDINSSECEMLADEFLGLDDNVCTAEEHPVTDEGILSSPVSNVDNG